jgi:hypothetical protein
MEEAVNKSVKGHRRKNHGMVLLLAMVFMLMLGILASTVLQTSMLQLRMAGNEQFLEEAFHRAHAIASEIAMNPENFSMDTTLGLTNCPVTSIDPDCDYHEIEALGMDIASSGATIEYSVVRQEPLIWRGFPIRESQETVSSHNSFEAAIFEVDVRIDGQKNKLGSAHVVQGVALRVTAMGQISAGEL